MTRHKPKPDPRLRARAEAASRSAPVGEGDLSEAQVRRLVHELEVHQIELEMQNEELRRAQGDLVDSRDRLSDLYDFAPVGYLSMEDDSTIIAANLTVASMLGVDRQRLLGRKFTRFVVPADQDLFYRHQEAVRSGASTESCELHLRRPDGGERIVQLDSISTEEGAADAGVLRTAVSDIAERERSRESAMRTDVLCRMVAAQEVERRRIGRELHDLLGQRLTSLRLNLERLRSGHARAEDIAGCLDAVTSDIQAMDREMDAVVRELRPTVLDDLGLQAALASHVRHWERQYGIATHFHDGDRRLPRLPDASESALYRIAQEALTNVARHAHASRVDFVLECHHEQLALVIEDDGVGFDPAATAVAGERLGLRGMAERAALAGATLEVESSPGNGTTVIVRLPIGRPVPGGG